MLRNSLIIICLVSVAHAMVHVYELSLPAVEQEIAHDYFADNPADGKAMTGRLSCVWRLMWGVGAVAAGWLVDRYGARRLLAAYLIGCAAACLMGARSSDQSTLMLAMILMGGMASIYHPAGLALISHETTAENRPRALGIHGIFGSAGIGTGPLAVGALLIWGCSWRQVFGWLAVPGALLGAVFVWQALRTPMIESRAEAHPDDAAEQEHTDWRAYLVLTGLAVAQGFVYSALMSFLPRYLSGVQIGEMSQVSVANVSLSNDSGNFMASGVLLIGCLGQWISGRLARPRLLEWQLTMVMIGNVPFLLWMSFAQDWHRALAAGLLALVHFMHQPIYNSLIAKYTPRVRRSLCYGFSFTCSLGVGSLGALFAGANESDQIVYGTLAAVTALSGAIGMSLALLARRVEPREPTSDQLSF